MFDEIDSPPLCPLTMSDQINLRSSPAWARAFFSLALPVSVALLFLPVDIDLVSLPNYIIIVLTRAIAHSRTICGTIRE